MAFPHPHCKALPRLNWLTGKSFVPSAGNNAWHLTTVRQLRRASRPPWSARVPSCGRSCGSPEADSKGRKQPAPLQSADRRWPHQGGEKPDTDRTVAVSKRPSASAKAPTVRRTEELACTLTFHATRTGPATSRPAWAKLSGSRIFFNPVTGAALPAGGLIFGSFVAFANRPVTGQARKRYPTIHPCV